MPTETPTGHTGLGNSVDNGTGVGGAGAGAGAETGAGVVVEPESPVATVANPPDSSGVPLPPAVHANEDLPTVTAASEAPDSVLAPAAGERGVGSHSVVPVDPLLVGPARGAGQSPDAQRSTAATESDHVATEASAAPHAQDHGDTDDTPVPAGAGSGGTPTSQDMSGATPAAEAPAGISFSPHDTLAAPPAPAPAPASAPAPAPSTPSTPAGGPTVQGVQGGPSAEAVEGVASCRRLCLELTSRHTLPNLL